MTRTLLSILTLLTAVSAGTPRETLDAWLSAHRNGNFDQAWALQTKTPGLPANLLEEERMNAKANFDRGGAGMKFEVLAERIEDDCAVFVLNESVKDGKPAFDLDPIYLFKQGTEWKVRADPAPPEPNAGGTGATFAKLEVWFKGFKQGALWHRNHSKSSVKTD